MKMKVELFNNIDVKNKYPYMATTPDNKFVLVVDDGYVYMETGLHYDWESTSHYESELKILPNGTQVILTQSF